MAVIPNQIAAKQIYLIEKCRAVRGCIHAQGDVGQIEQKMIKLLTEIDFSGRMPQKIADKILYHHILKIGISGCPNGCAQPQIKDIGLIFTGHPGIDPEECSGCGSCAEACKENAISLDQQDVAKIIANRCLACGDCILACPFDAISRRKKGLRLMLGGKLGRHPRLAREWGEFFDTEEVIQELKIILENYLQDAQGEMKLGAWLDQIEEKQKEGMN